MDTEVRPDYSSDWSAIRVWLPALAQAGLPDVHFHDLRNTGNALTASAGASLCELMGRMGHASTRAALVYLHDTADRQRAIAAAVSGLAQQKLGQLAGPIEAEAERDRARGGHERPDL